MTVRFLDLCFSHRFFSAINNSMDFFLQTFQAFNSIALELVETLKGVSFAKYGSMSRRETSILFVAFQQKKTTPLPLTATACLQEVLTLLTCHTLRGPCQGCRMLIPRQGLVAKVEAQSASGRPIRKDSPLHLVRYKKHGYTLNLNEQENEPNRMVLKKMFWGGQEQWTSKL